MRYLAIWLSYAANHVGGYKNIENRISLLPFRSEGERSVTLLPGVETTMTTIQENLYQTIYAATLDHVVQHLTANVIKTPHTVPVRVGVPKHALGDYSAHARKQRRAMHAHRTNVRWSVAERHPSKRALFIHDWQKLEEAYVITIQSRYTGTGGGDTSDRVKSGQGKYGTSDNV
ncbi:hypothetical protein BDQ17DRAFT_648609 [Cyathus striatus]|nr:hypothetical protein BDQ17DRAFT_648609 [Cyathus striatus]